MKTQNSVMVDQENQENFKVRKPLKTLQDVTINENTSGSTSVCTKCKSAIVKDSSELKPSALKNAEVQTVTNEITIEDLTSPEEPPPHYWRKLAETHAKSLNDSFEERDRLERLVEALQSENDKSNEMLDEARTLVEVLKEIIEENDAEEVPSQGSD